MDNATQAATSDAAVAHNLDQADKVEKLNGEVHASTEAHGGPAAHTPDPSALGLNATAWVSLAMLVLLAVMVFKKVPGIITGILDSRIDAIKSQLDEAAKLRAEAEALKAEYEKKLKSAAKDAKALKERAEEEAKLLVEEAKVHAEDIVKRRKKMAEDKIAAAERAAVDEIRAKTVQAATSAAAALLAQKHTSKEDKGLVDGAIASLGTIN